MSRKSYINPDQPSLFPDEFPVETTGEMLARIAETARRIGAAAAAQTTVEAPVVVSAGADDQGHGHHVGNQVAETL